MQDELNYVFDGMQMFTVFPFPDSANKVVQTEVSWSLVRSINQGCGISCVLETISKADFVN